MHCPARNPSGFFGIGMNELALKRAKWPVGAKPQSKVDQEFRREVGRLQALPADSARVSDRQKWAVTC